MISECVSWVVSIEGLASLLKSVGRGDFIAGSHPAIKVGTARSLELLGGRGLVKRDGYGVRLTELGRFTLESLEALDWLPEIG